jgi:hypothetical protein
MARMGCKGEVMSCGGGKVNSGVLKVDTCGDDRKKGKSNCKSSSKSFAMLIATIF